MRKVLEPPPPLPALSTTEWSWSERLRGLTSIVRGGSRSDGIDPDRPVRGPSIRGQLRSWWRATHATTDAATLLREERALFGAVHGGTILASRVRVGVRDPRSRPEAAPSPLGYGLWPLRRTEGPQLHGEVSAIVDLTGPREHEQALTRAVEAWLLCSGLGGRSRRGYGALWPESWPGFASAEAWAARIGALAPPPGRRGWPSLAGATYLTWAGDFAKPAEAVQFALDRFRAARGMEQVGPKNFDGSKRYPPIQNQDWQAVKDGRGQVEHWPALGLPIQVRSSDSKHFPGTREIKPRGGQRLPSPVLVRPIPLASGRFAPGLIVLRLWAFPSVEVKNAREVTGRVRQESLDGFVEFLVQKGARRLGGDR